MIDRIQKAAMILRQGGLVAFPTETVYGLGADASNPEALRKIFIAKQRPMDHPLIVHVGKLAQLENWVSSISETAYLLAHTFWPGPLTLIFNKHSQVNDLITGGQTTIGIRIPNHPIALSLLQEFGGGIAAPSANRFGRISPTSSEAVWEELNGAIDFILEGGVCDVGVESTILDVSGEQCVLLRPGMITKDQIENLIQKPILLKQKEIPRVSGSFESHYAPQTPTILVKELDHYLNQEHDFPIGIVSFQDVASEEFIAVKMSHDPKQYAHELYRVLRELDKQNLKKIIIETVPENAAWDAIRDRIAKASSR